jgi:hypothetical protein
MQNAGPGSFEAHSVSENTLVLRQDAEMGPTMITIIRMQGGGEVSLRGLPCMEGLDGARCQVVLSTEDPPFAPDPQAPEVRLEGEGPTIRFQRPSAVLLRAWRKVPVA